MYSARNQKLILQSNVIEFHSLFHSCTQINAVQGKAVHFASRIFLNGAHAAFCISLHFVLHYTPLQFALLSTTALQRILQQWTFLRGARSGHINLLTSGGSCEKLTYALNNFAKLKLVAKSCNAAQFCSMYTMYDTECFYEV